MRFTIILTFILSTSLLNSQEYKLLSWDDLKPQTNFEDPYKKLTKEQLYNLGQLANYIAKESNAQSSLSTKEIEDKKKIQEWLKTEGIDYDYLFSIRQEVEEMRRIKNEGMNESIDNTSIEISGYLLPLNFQNKKANEFLLVPWVGACIHTPPPAKNQIIFVRTTEWVDAIELFDPVLISGTINIDEKTSDLFLSDGTSKINTGYSVQNGSIFKF